MLVGTWYLFPEQQPPPASPHSWAPLGLLPATLSKNPLEEMEYLLVNRRVQNAVLGCSLQNDRMISVPFQGKPFNITVMQVYAPTTNGGEAQGE